MPEANEISQADLKLAIVPPKDTAESPLATRFAQQVKRYLASEDAAHVTYDNPDRQGRGVAERTVTVESEDGNTEITLLADDMGEHGSSSVRAIWFDRAERTAGDFRIIDDPNMPMGKRISGDITNVTDSEYEFMENGGNAIGGVFGSIRKVTRGDVERITGLLETGQVNADLTQKSVKVLQDRYGAIPQPNALRALKQSVSQPPSPGSNAAGGIK